MRVFFFPLVLYAFRASAALLPRASSTPSCTYTCGSTDQDGFANYPGYTADNAGTLHCEYPDPTTPEQNQYTCEYNDVSSSIFMIMTALTCAVANRNAHALDGRACPSTPFAVYRGYAADNLHRTTRTGTRSALPRCRRARTAGASSARTISSPCFARRQVALPPRARCPSCFTTRTDKSCLAHFVACSEATRELILRLLLLCDSALFFPAVLEISLGCFYRA
jgi:hypothetical protein